MARATAILTRVWRVALHNRASQERVHACDHERPTVPVVVLLRGVRLCAQTPLLGLRTSKRSEQPTSQSQSAHWISRSRQ